MTRNTFVSSRLANPAIVNAMKADPLYHILRGEKGGPIDQYFFEHERSIYTGLFDNKIALERSELIMDPHRWSLLATIAESLEWMNERIRVLADPSSAITQTKDDSKFNPRRRPTTDARISVVVANRQDMKAKIASAASKRIAAIFGPNQDFMARHFLQLSDLCLFSLRMELSVHCFFFLSSIRAENYWLSEDPLTPEPFILDLNSDLALVEEKLSGLIVADKIKYLFGSTANLMSAIVIQIAGQLSIPRVNRNGVAQMCRNLFALQQNLTNIVVTHDGYFDRARQYWELLLLPEEELMNRYNDAKVKEQNRSQSVFSAQELKSLFKIHTQLRKSNNNI